MGINTKIYLSEEANGDNLIKVIQKIMGYQYEFSNFDNKKFDITKESSKTNDWHIDFKDRNLKDMWRPDSYTIGSGRLCFSDNYGNDYNAHMFIERLRDDPHEIIGGKKIYPNMSPVWILIGRKLVDFFGGKVMYSDCADEEDPKNWYINENPIFNSNGKNGDDRWFCFQNAIKNFEFTQDDISYVVEHFGEDNRLNAIQEHVSYLAKLKLVEKLDTNIEIKQDTIKKNKI